MQDAFPPPLKISLAIKERREAEEANVRLKVMRGDEAKFRRSLEEKRREKYEVLVEPVLGA